MFVGDGDSNERFGVVLYANHDIQVAISGHGKRGSKVNAPPVEDATNGQGVERGGRAIEGGAYDMAMGAGGNNGVDITLHAIPPVGSGQQVVCALDTEVTSLGMLRLNQGLAVFGGRDQAGGTVRHDTVQGVGDEIMVYCTFDDALAFRFGKIGGEQARS